MQTERLLLKIALSTIYSLSLKEKINLAKSLDNLHDLALHSSIETIEAKIGRPLLAKSWNPEENARLARAAFSRMNALGISCVFFDEKEFPSMLREINDPPYALFFRGDLKILEGNCVSVVGTRKITGGAKIAAHDFSYDAASDGTTVISGLALGVDGEAHRGALDAFFDGKTSVAKTAAVLAGGVDNIYPVRHKKIAAQILQNGGCILSESAPGIPSEKWRFVQRNRICAGLSRATLVIQAPPGSGSLITADFALGYNRELLFHEACFSDEANAISKMVRANLAGKEGSAARKKIEANCERYVSDGAEIVKSYKDFCEKISSVPGMKNSDATRELF
ncbi:MAG: DNA-processing protein DprA [Treponema sp.]|nr:DNA-processing protein DprA [Treponema sp.]